MQRVPSLTRSLGMLLCLALCLGCRAEPPALTPRAPLAYIEDVTGGADPESALPLLIVLHGLGDPPEHVLDLFRKLTPPTRLIAPRAPDPWGEGTSWYPVPARTPAIIAARAERVAELIRYVTRLRPTRGKAVVTGFSQGGVLSYTLAATRAELIAGAVPIAAMLPAAMAEPSSARSTFKLRAFHGTADARIAFADAERSVARFKARGVDAQLAAFPGVGHAVSSEMRQQIYATLKQLLTQ
jgi:phospholipase/carboxylesterase